MWAIPEINYFLIPIPRGGGGAYEIKKTIFRHWVYENGGGGVSENIRPVFYCFALKIKIVIKLVDLFSVAWTEEIVSTCMHEFNKAVHFVKCWRTVKRRGRFLSLQVGSRRLVENRSWWWFGINPHYQFYQNFLKNVMYAKCKVFLVSITPALF